MFHRCPACNRQVGNAEYAVVSKLLATLKKPASIYNTHLCDMCVKAGKTSDDPNKTF